MTNHTLPGSEYAAPEMEICDMPAEVGFVGSGDFGDEGRTGNINYGKENDIDI